MDSFSALHLVRFPPPLPSTEEGLTRPRSSLTAEGEGEGVRSNAVPYFSSMRIGYACINQTLGCTSGSTFRLASYSEARLMETVTNNLFCLERTLQFNVDHGILFFRISSALIPFASHPINQVDWVGRFQKQFAAIGRFIRQNGIRIGMHPDQFVVLNSNRPEVIGNSVAELTYHAKVLDAMGLPASAKIQIHLGAAYNDKNNSMNVFVQEWRKLDRSIRRRLVIENDDRVFSAADCLQVSRIAEIPVVLDTFHHECLNNGEPLREVLEQAAATWRKADGRQIVDYSSQQQGKRRGAHTASLDAKHFRKFLSVAGDLELEMDVMIEIKDKEKSALRAVAFLEAARKEKT